jgi:hypothetical protein
MLYNASSLSYPMHSEKHDPSGLYSGKLDVDGLCSDYDTRKQKACSDKLVSSHVDSVSSPCEGFHFLPAKNRMASTSTESLFTTSVQREEREAHERS